MPSPAGISTRTASYRLQKVCSRSHSISAICSGPSSGSRSTSVSTGLRRAVSSASYRDSTTPIRRRSPRPKGTVTRQPGCTGRPSGTR